MEPVADWESLRVEMVEGQESRKDRTGWEREDRTGRRTGKAENKQLEFMGMEAPTLEQLEEELKREQNKNNIKHLLRNTVFFLLVVAAAVILVAVLFLPPVQIEGTSMADTLQEGEIVMVRRGNGYGAGDIIAFHHNNDILVKRVIALSGDSVEIDGEGNVSVNGELWEEPYVREKALGNCDITFPCEVPEDEVFVLGDNRPVSVDSRDSGIGCVGQDMVIGKVVARIW